MNYYYLLIFLLPIYFVIKYFLYKLNLKLLFKGNNRKVKFNKNKIELFFKKYNNQEIKVENFNIRCEGEYLDCIYLENKKHKNYLTLYFHGNRGNIYDSLYKNDIKNILLYSNVFIFDYRGYGNSTGYSNENSIVTDSSVIYYFVMNVIGYNSKNILFYGNSLGGHISTNLVNYLNLNLLPLPRGLILQSPFYSLYEISKTVYPYLHYLIQYNPNNSYLLKRIKNTIPILLLHSHQDEYIDLYHSKMLYEENKNNIDFYPIKGLHDMIYYDNDVNIFIRNKFKLNK